MADFNLFFPILLHDEGYWANTAGDSGGHTWEGIAQNKHPDWAGFAIIDSHTELNFNDASEANIQLINATLRADPRLQPLVISFYKPKVWDVIGGDGINSQSIANFIADWGANAGDSVPIRHAQQLVGVAVDGEVGPNTINAINGTDAQTLFNALKQSRITFYNAVVQVHPEDEKFLQGWIGRTNSFIFQS